ncbi:MAG: hypothetical protein R3Y22_00350 [Bacteroidales bacterium]
MKYRNLDDKCYGVTGMALSMVVLNAEDMFTHITIEEEGLKGIGFIEDFYYSGNPSVSAKSTWNIVVEHYKIAIAVVLANVMCRKMVRERVELDAKTRNKLLKALIAEGESQCQLEEDEITTLFNKTYNYLGQLFANYQVRGLLTQFAKELKTRKKMSQREVMDIFQALQMM